MPENILQANRRVSKRGTLGLYCHDYATNWRVSLWESGVYSAFIAIIITINAVYYCLLPAKSGAFSAVY